MSTCQLFLINGTKLVSFPHNTGFQATPLPSPPLDEFGAHLSLGPTGLRRELAKEISGDRACKTVRAETVIIMGVLCCSGLSALPLAFCCHRQLNID